MSKKKNEKETRVIRDKRTSRKEHAAVFKRVIKYYKKKKREEVAKTDLHSLYIPPNRRGMKKFSVYVRKRPIFEHEIKRGEYDIVSCYPQISSIVVHNAKMRADLKITSAFVENNEFTGFEGVFSEKDDNETVYQNTVMSLLQFVLSGKRGVIFMYGQTGSGKTYTITSTLDNAVNDIYLFLMYQPHLKVVVSCFEMSGEKCNDLLNKRAKVILRADGSGVIRTCNIKEVMVNNGPELRSTIEKAFNSRKTIATKVNSVSSRSHCIFSIAIVDTRRGKVYAELKFVDLAGSERNEDTFHHNQARIVESCKINSSLMSLKECIRIYNQNRSRGQKNRIPFRNDRLTMFLKQCFTDKDVRTVIFATVSPSPTDTEHTMNTLKHSCLMNEKSNIDQEVVNVSDVLKLNSKPKFKHPQKWTTSETFKWIGSVKNGRYRKYVENFPSQLDGKQLCRFSKKRLAQICNGSEKVGESLRKLLLRQIKKYEDQKSSQVKNNRALAKGKQMF